MFAQFLHSEISKNLEQRGESEDANHSDSESDGEGDRPKPRKRRRVVNDSNYRPPKTRRTGEGREELAESSAESEDEGDEIAGGSGRSEDPTAEIGQRISSVPAAGATGLPPADSIDTEDTEMSQDPDPEPEIAANSGQATASLGARPSSGLPRVETPPRLLPQEVAPSTSSQQITQAELTSPLTEEVHVDTSPLQLASPGNLPRKCQLPSLMDLVLDAVELVTNMKPEPQQETDVHGLLSVVQRSLKSSDAIVVALPSKLTNVEAWSATRWIRLLQERSSRNRLTTAMTMLEWMALSIWYDAKKKEAETAEAKSGKSQKQIATMVLDSIYKSKEVVQESDHLSETGMTTIASAKEIRGEIKERERRLIIKHCDNGSRLRRMASKAGLGILLLKNIW